MTDQIQWLHEIENGVWEPIARAMRAGLPVPGGFVASARSTELSIRAAYEELKVREFTHYVALRGPWPAALDVIGTDRMVHTLKHLWRDSPEGEVLIQAMINSAWCGNATIEGRNLRIRASQGLLSLDPDTYLFNSSSGKCTRRTLHQSPRKVFRAVDGSTRTMTEIERRPLEVKYLEAIAELAGRVAADFTWALDHRRVWLIGL